MSPLTEPTRIVLAKGYFLPDDPDAVAYITAVETADTAAGSSGGLEPATRMAINTFVKGCKADGTWPALKASCILAGARTLAGALVPLVGTAPTSTNFVSGDYNRKTGLLGAAGKSLNSNRANNADPTNNNHNAVYMPAKTPVPSAANSTNLISSSYISGWNNISVYGDGVCYVYNRQIAETNAGSYSTTLPFLGTSRSLPGSFNYRVRGATVPVTAASQTAGAGNLVLGPSPNGRFAFYSIGESIDLASLDTRVTALITAFAAAIP